MKYLTLITLALATTAQADFWDNCTAYGGTIITANSYGNDKGGLCNDPNDSSKTNNCNGKRFCRSGNSMNWWSSFTWCESIGGKLASFESACPGTPFSVRESDAESCPNLINLGLQTWHWTGLGAGNNGAYLAGYNGIARTYSPRTNTAANIKTFCEEK